MTGQSYRADMGLPYLGRYASGIASGDERCRRCGYANDPPDVTVQLVRISLARRPVDGAHNVTILCTDCSADLPDDVVRDAQLKSLRRENAELGIDWPDKPRRRRRP